MVLSKSQITADIKAVARVLGHSPSSVEYGRFGRYHVRTVQRKFDQRWPEIMNTIGLRYAQRTCARIASTDELKRDVLRVAHQLGHAPSRREYGEQGKFNAETIRRRSGQRNWENAIAAMGGFKVEDIKSSQAKGGHYRTTKQWLTKVYELYMRLGHAPTTAEANAAGINSHDLSRRLNGKWIDVLAAANVDLKKRSRRAQLLSTPTELLIEDVLRISRRLGRPAKAGEYAAVGHYSSVILAARLGGWKQTKKIVREKLYGPCVHHRGKGAGLHESDGHAINRFFNRQLREVNGHAFQ